jgi:hypothetical protein
MKTTGSSSRMLALSRPFASAGVAGAGAEHPLGSNDCVAGYGIGLQVHHVHVAAAALHDSRSFAVELSPETLEVSPASEIVAGTAVAGDNAILFFQNRGKSGRDCFLAQTGQNVTLQLAGLEEFEHAQFHGAN